MKPKDPISPTGWWMVGLLERHERSDAVKYWNNYRLVKAEHWREAYTKALVFGEKDALGGNRAFSGPTEFLGITDLVPIYDPFEDGAEVLFEDFDTDQDDSGGPPLGTFTEEEMEAIYEPDPDTPKPA